MTDKRIYILVPKTVQIMSSDNFYTFIDPTKDSDRNERTFVMEPGRLMAQCSHVGRLLEHTVLCEQMSIENYKEITTIVLAVRNSKELRKVANEIHAILEYIDPDLTNGAFCVEFSDSNPDYYKSYDKVLTAVAVGPVEKETIESAIGHLELYS